MEWPTDYLVFKLESLPAQVQRAGRIDEVDGGVIPETMEEVGTDGTVPV